MKIANKARLGLIAGVAAAGLTLGVFAPAANADPVTYYGTVSGTGSDTTQDVYNGLSSDLKDGSGKPFVASYDATVPPFSSDFIRTRAGGVNIPRPNGSGQGTEALKAAKTSAILTNARGTSQLNNANAALSPSDLQFARSSSRPSNPSPTGAYSWVPLGVDAVSFAVHNTNSVIPTVGSFKEIPLGASVGEVWSGTRLKLTLKNIFGLNTVPSNGKVTLYPAATGTGFTLGNQTSAAQIVPFIPQSGSGTRSFWQGIVGGTYGSHVSDTYLDGTTKSVQEHDGSVLAALPSSAIVPFSVAQFLAQNRSAQLSSNYGVTVTNRLKGAVVGAIYNGSAANKIPYSGTPSTGTLNSNFEVKRDVYTVVSYADINVAGTLRTVFGPGGSAYSSAAIADFGFGTSTSVAQGNYTTIRGSL